MSEEKPDRIDEAFRYILLAMFAWIMISRAYDYLSGVVRRAVLTNESRLHLAPGRGKRYWQEEHR